VLTDDWAFPEMVAPGRTGALVPAGNVQALAEQLIGLLRDPDGLRSMGAAGRALVEEKFTWSAVVRRLRKELTSTDQPNR
jgi:glycosyltransferase involved in cell wall biosynthesis